ncbi:hypothetical protein GCM10010307_58570 [Streptomyces vastus]|uniref:Uncharacterized protein n=1 Tax=Streptomyces vastus TaxID=285451 RepID=A0ABP6DPC9_9ACTN
MLRYDPESGLSLSLIGAFADRITSNPAPGVTAYHEGTVRREPRHLPRIRGSGAPGLLEALVDPKRLAQLLLREDRERAGPAERSPLEQGVGVRDQPGRALAP